jgi:hypothetical protein
MSAVIPATTPATTPTTLTTTGMPNTTTSKYSVKSRPTLQRRSRSHRPRPDASLRDICQD